MQRDGEKSISAEEALCSKLAERKPEKFSKQELIKAGEQNGFHVYMRGAVSPFSFIGFSQDPRSGTGKGSPALLLCVTVKNTDIEVRNKNN